MIRDPEAYEFAARKHDGQTRKYTGEPYVTHCVRVAEMLPRPMNQDAIAAAYLHDTLEDTDTTFDELWRLFGYGTASLVLQLTEFSSPSDGNRATRKALDRRYLARVSPDAQTIKLADLIDNTSDILKHDPDFAKVYVKEKALLLPHLKYGAYPLLMRAYQQLAEATHQLQVAV